MSRRDWKKIARYEFEAMDKDEQDSFRDLRQRSS